MTRLFERVFDKYTRLFRCEPIIKMECKAGWHDLKYSLNIQDNNGNSLWWSGQSPRSVLKKALKDTSEAHSGALRLITEKLA